MIGARAEKMPYNTAADPRPQLVNTVARVLVQTHETLLACESLAMQVRCSISNAPYPEANDEMDDGSIKRESSDVLLRCHDNLARACAIKRQLEAALEVLG
jgi:hypothetical protein